MGSTGEDMMQTAKASALRIDSVALFQCIIRRWYVLIVGGILGGIVGLALASLRAPVYESMASLLVAVDYGGAEISKGLTIYQSLDRVRALILADDTLTAARGSMPGEATAGKIPANPTELRAHLRVAQTPSGFDLYTYFGDPNAGSDFTNAWAQVSLDELGQSFLHAVRASDLQRELYDSHCELGLSGEGAAQRVVWKCDTTDVDPAASELPEALLNEVRLSHGIPPFLSFSILEQAAPADGPVLWARSSLILGGTLAGLTTAALLLGISCYGKSSDDD
jgi:hypothetical protein